MVLLGIILILVGAVVAYTFHRELGGLIVVIGIVVLIVGLVDRTDAHAAAGMVMLWPGRLRDAITRGLGRRLRRAY